MTRIAWKAAVAAAAVCAACGRGGDAHGSQMSQPSGTMPAGDPNPAATPDGGTEAPPRSDAPAPLVAELRLLGVDQAAFTSARVKVKSVEASANGAPIAIGGLVDGIDLGVPTQAWLLGTFTVPDGAEAVEVRIVFEDAGAFDAGTAHGAIDSGCTAIVATLPVRLLVLRGHAVFQMDVARSLVRLKDDAAMLVPDFEIAY